MKLNHQAQEQEKQAALPAMVTVKCKFFGEIRDVVGGTTAELVVPQGCTLGELLAQMGDTYGESFTRRVLNRYGDLQPLWTRIYLNDNPMEGEGALDTKLDGPGAQVTIFVLSAIEGGQATSKNS